MFEVCRSRVLHKTNLFLLAFLHATGLALVNKAITKKRIAILINEITSLLSLTLGTGNKSLVRSIIFFYYQRKQELKTKDGRDLIKTLTLMTAATNIRSFRYWETKHA